MIHILLHFFRRIGEQLGNYEKRRNDAYLCEAVDLYDLERRMRELDRRQRAPSF